MQYQSANVGHLPTGENPEYDFRSSEIDFQFKGHSTGLQVDFEH
jgi:hypothetical protein